MGSVLTPRINNIEEVAYLKDVKASGTSGQALTAATYVARTLNTLTGNSSFCTLANGTTGTDGTADSFILTAGTYIIEASAPAVAPSTAGDPGYNKAKLRNTTDNVDVIIGSSEMSYAISGTASGNRSQVSGVFTIASTKTFQLQHRSEITYANGGGAASSFGDVEVYTIVKITKVGV